MPTDLGTHAELEERRRWRDPTECPGRMLVSGQLGDVTEIECDRCGFCVGVPTRQVSPAAYIGRLTEQRREQSGIPPRLRGLSLPQDGSDHSRALRDWATGHAERPVLTLCGDVGVGKTHAAAAALWERAKVDRVRWIYVPALFRHLALAFSDEDRHEALRSLDGTETLVLDDIDKSPEKQFAGDDLLCAINTRIEAGAGVMVTTNLVLADLADRYPVSGYAIASRLSGEGETFLIEGRDRRLERFAA